MRQEKPLRKLARWLASAAGPALLAGCSRAPSFSILGSYFPAWLVCIIAGVVMSAITNWILTRYRLDKLIAWPVVVYPCLAAFFACTLWLMFFN
jgi:ABC-type uncharacterized transport system permease subunit